MQPNDYTPGAPIRTADELRAWLAHEDALYVHGALVWSAVAREHLVGLTDERLAAGHIRQALVKVKKE